MVSNKLWKTKFSKASKFLLVLIIIFSWIFSGWPRIYSFAQETTSTPPNQTTVSPLPDQTATSTPDKGFAKEEEGISAAVSEPIIELAPEPPRPQPPALKERKLNKEVRIDKNASHRCAAKNFTVDVSGKDLSTVEIEFLGRRDSSENVEIGSLPLGVDITFLNNADYSYSPSRSDNGAVLQIANQPGSQKGNFSIPIIYASGNSTIICQINVINF